MVIQPTFTNSYSWFQLFTIPLNVCRGIRRRKLSPAADSVGHCEFVSADKTRSCWSCGCHRPSRLHPHVCLGTFQRRGLYYQLHCFQMLFPIIYANLLYLDAFYWFINWVNPTLLLSHVKKSNCFFIESIFTGLQEYATSVCRVGRPSAETFMVDGALPQVPITTLRLLDSGCKQYSLWWVHTLYKDFF